MNDIDKIRKARNEYFKEYRAANREKLREYQKEWRHNNKDKMKVINDNYWLKKAEGIL